ncbi:MAG TPA: VOC family protein [Acidimicrobiia bacterium]|nr:VOC family protein [Acidimicrobiia bacterium]
MSERAVFDHVNIVGRDMQATIAFYERLGVEVNRPPAPWDRHHVNTETDVDFDSTEFATHWNESWRAGETGVVINFRLASREAVDETYGNLTGAGYEGKQAPWDAFWGARFAIVADPDGNLVGFMSPSDPARRYDVQPPA